MRTGKIPPSYEAFRVIWIVSFWAVVIVITIVIIVAATGNRNG